MLSLEVHMRWLVITCHVGREHGGTSKPKDRPYMVGWLVTYAVCRTVRYCTVLSYAVLAVHISGTPQKIESGRFFAEAGPVRSPWRFWLGRRGVATNVSKELQPPAWQVPRGKKATRQTWI